MSTANQMPISQEPNAVIMTDVAFSYPSSNTVMRCNDWSLQKGERIFLFGDSGSGKSTLLSLLSGIAPPNKGSIALNGINLNELSSKQRDKYRAQHIGIVFQQFNLIPYLSVYQNIQLAAYFAKNSVQLDQKIQSMLENLKLPKSVLPLQVALLSVGQKQRVAIMRAFINSPELLLIDEPTSALDANARDGFMQMLMSITQSLEATMVFVSHDQSLRQYFDQHIAVTDICHWSGAKEAIC